MDNNLIEYKLNLIQKMRLSISKRFVTLSSYAKYPDYLTQDEQIISQLLRKYQLQDIIKNEKLSDERKKTILKVADKSQILDREFDTSHKLLKALFIGIMYFFWIFFYLFRVFSCVLLRVVV